MHQAIKRAITYERVVIGVTGLCILSLYAVGLAFQPATAYPMIPVISVEGNGVRGEPLRDNGRVPIVKVSSSDKLSDVFERIGYRLDGVRRHGEVPRVFIATLPPDLSHIAMPADRKVMFIKSSLPLILHVNELILAERMRIEILATLSEAWIELDSEDVAWLEKLRKRHDLEKLDFEALLRRIDVIPPSLAIAQAAEESGWGTSRFAREGNALFGQRIYKGKRGIVPKRRDDGERHKVRAFDHLIDGIKAYADNLNSHSAYASFRKAREKMRLAGVPIDGDELAKTLVRYSERREDYVRAIRQIIRTNGLQLFDKTRLGESLTIISGVPDA